MKRICTQVIGHRYRNRYRGRSRNRDRSLTGTCSPILASTPIAIPIPIAMVYIQEPILEAIPAVIAPTGKIALHLSLSPAMISAFLEKERIVTRIYTKTGDDGTTGLIGGKRVPKDAPRVEAYGTVDELNAVLGVARSFSLPPRADEIVGKIQDSLFTIGAALALAADANPRDWGIPSIREEDVTALEREIDACEELLQPLAQFIVPGGTTPAAMLNLARTFARRAERRCILLARTEGMDPLILRYLNRLSDLCFVLARYVNHERGISETHPTFGKS